MSATTDAANQPAIHPLHEDYNLQQVEGLAHKIEVMLMDKYECLTQATYAELNLLCSLYNRKAQILQQAKKAQ